jgi:hypothetical protein
VAALLEGRRVPTRSVHVPLINDVDADGNVEYDLRHRDRPLS